MNLRRLGLSLIALLSLVNPSVAQNNFTMPPPAGVVLIGAQVVAACGAGTLSPTQAFVTLDATGALCTNASGGGGGGAITSPLTAGGADGVANTLSGVQTYARLQMYNGATWDRVLGDTTNGLWVNVKNALAAVGNNADAVAAGASAGSPVVNYNYVWNGSTWDRQSGTTAGTKVNTAQIGGVTVTADPCQTNAKSYLPITATTSLVKVIAIGVSAKKIYVCQIILATTAANNVAVFEATTGTTCATSAAAVYGAGTSVATAANGFPFSANGGVSLGNGGFTVAQTATIANDLCIGTSAATPLTGGILYATN